MSVVERDAQLAAQLHARAAELGASSVAQALDRLVAAEAPAA